MDDKTKLQVICLQVLALAGMLLGRIPKVQTVVDLLTHLVQEHWDDLWSLSQKKAQGKKLMKAAKEEGTDVTWPDCSQEVMDAMDRIADEFGPQARPEGGEGNEAGQPKGKAKGKANGNGNGGKPEYRH